MQFSAENIEKVQSIVELMKKGFVKAKKLAEQTGLTERQIYRYLEFGKEHGYLYSPYRGIYSPAEINVIPFQSYAISNSRNVNYRMSQSKQHNISKQTYRDIDLSEIHKSKKESIKGQRLKDKPESDIEEMSQTESLIDIIVRVLDIAKIPYGERDLKFAMNALHGVAWWLINDENITEYTMESVRRMYERLERDPQAVKTNAVGYFFGIYRNVLASDTRYLKRQWAESLPAYIQLAAGAEEVAVTTGAYRTTGDSSDVGNDSKVEEDDEITAISTVPAEWLSVQTLLSEIIREYTVYGVKSLTSSIEYVIQQLDVQDVSVSNVEAALTDVKTYDMQASQYLVRLVKSRVVPEIQAQLNRHFQRSLKRTSRVSTRNHTKSSHDERYNNFYSLFPSESGVGKNDERYNAFYNLFPNE